MGWERKRGKLRELNRLLRGATDTSFLPPDPGAAPAPSGIRYVITLDADSRLPREAARELVGTIAHPLNLPGFDAAASRVVEGHALLQPRVTPTLPETGWGTLFQLVFSGPRGIDLYAFAVSDVYQDLFGEGIYTGKGIYDVDAFERALDDRVPENTQLSHDLFEGLFARAGFVSDVELFEGFPAAYEVAASRQHRWVRGDWQLLPWILGLAPSVPGPPGNDAIPAIARWKMLDNLRRSLSPPATFALLVAAWCLPGAGAGSWTAMVLGVYVLPTLLAFFGSLLPKRRGVAKRSFLRGIAADLAIGLAQAALRLTLLAHAAWLRADAIGRTLWRVCVSRRHMLEWTPAAQAHRALDLKVGGLFLRMRGALVLAAGAAALLAASGSHAWGLAVPFLAAWALSPLVAWWVSQPPRPAASARISEATATEFRQIARRTWAYFERFAGGEFHGLPADNFQEEPQPEVARRTSPTNVGLGLLATVAANDFGWIGTVEMAERLEAALAAIGRLELYRGHLYNWYGTTDLAPLEPRYVSTVDSGNLAAHLIVLKQACLERAAEPVLSGRALEGIGDTLAARARRGGGARPRRLRSRRHVAAARGGARRGPRAARSGAGDGGRVGFAAGGARRLRGDAGGHRAGAGRRRLARGGPGPGVVRWRCAPRSRATRATSAQRESRCSPPSRSRPGWPPSRARPTACSPGWTSPSCTTPRGISSRSATVRWRERSTPATTTCSPRRRAWRASWRSRAATCPSSTGSTSAGP